MSLQVSANQTVFAYELSKKTGLDPKVIIAWMRNEQPAENANPASSGLYNFLNVGVTGSGNYGTGDSIWNSPVTAADATAAWLKGSPTAVPGYGASAAGIQAIERTAGGSPAAQIAAIQHSGWAGAGETALPSLYAQAVGGISVVGTPTNVIPPDSGLTTALNTLLFGGGASSPTDIVGSVGGTGATAAANAAGIPTDPIGSAFQNFTKWIGKAGLNAALVIAGLVLLVVAFGRQTGARLKPGMAAAL
jgi:hypothetical protein